MCFSIQSEEELFKKTVKKFGSSSKVWTLFAQFYLTNGRPNEARDLLPRSLKSLEKRKREPGYTLAARGAPLLTCCSPTDLKTITKFAQLEFKLGDAERGRTIFEGVVDSYPKRLDLWFVYIDMEIKQRNVLGVRALFERVLVQRLSSSEFGGLSLVHEAFLTLSHSARERQVRFQEVARVREGVR